MSTQAVEETAKTREEEEKLEKEQAAKDAKDVKRGFLSNTGYVEGGERRYIVAVWLPDGKVIDTPPETQTSVSEDEGKVIEYSYAYKGLTYTSEEEVAEAKKKLEEKRAERVEKVAVTRVGEKAFPVVLMPRPLAMPTDPVAVTYGKHGAKVGDMVVWKYDPAQRPLIVASTEGGRINCTPPGNFIFNNDEIEVVMLATEPGVPTLVKEGEPVPPLVPVPVALATSNKDDYEPERAPKTAKETEAERKKQEEEVKRAKAEAEKRRAKAQKEEEGGK
jgi:hypothetical protein